MKSPEVIRVEHSPFATITVTREEAKVLSGVLQSAINTSGWCQRSYFEQAAIKWAADALAAQSRGSS